MRPGQDGNFDLQFILGMMDLDLALLETKPPKPTHGSLPEEKAKYEKWEESNRLSLLLMKSKMSNSVQSFVPQSDNAKHYLDGIEKLVVKFDEEASMNLYCKVFRGVNYEYDGQGSVREHIFKMCSPVNRLRGIGQEISDRKLLDAVLLSLPSEFEHILEKAEVERWELYDIAAECSQWEGCLREKNGFLSYIRRVHSMKNGNGGSESDDPDIEE